MLESLTRAPDDPILGLTAAFQRDPRPNKVNLSAGVYKDARGQTPVFRSVKLAEARLLEEETTKNYLPIRGRLRTGQPCRRSSLRRLRAFTGSGRVVSAQAPGGTGAPARGRRADPPGESGRARLAEPAHLAKPPNVFQAAGLAVEWHPYFDPATNSLRFEEMLAALGGAAPGDVVLLHGCCHNPTGIDPTVAQWRELGRLLAEKSLIPFVDFAYQGLATAWRRTPQGYRRCWRAAPKR